MYVTFVPSAVTIVPCISVCNTFFLYIYIYLTSFGNKDSIHTYFERQQLTLLIESIN